VWIEPQDDGTMEEFEMAIPANWVCGRKVYLPNHLNVKRSFKQREDPTASWKCFKLIKLKLENGNLYNF